MSERTEEILTVAGAVSACTEEERTLLRRLCEAAEDEAQHRLRAGLTAEDCPGAFVCAAAWLAAAALETTRGGEELSSLRAGDLTIRTAAAKEHAARAETLRAQAEKLLRPYAAQGGFCFREVRG